MLYGRRPFQHNNNTAYRRRKIRILNREFQYRYTKYLVSLMGISVILFGFPAYYFVNQNYKMFFDLAYQTSPDLLVHLEREIVSLNTYLITGSLALVAFCAVVGLRLTARLVGPVALIESHLREVTKGRWASPALRLRENDEFKELVKSYNYFYRSLRLQTENEIRILEKLKNGGHSEVEHNRILNNLLAMKREQIGIEDRASVIDLFSSGSSDRALQPQTSSLPAYRKPSSL